MTNVLIRDKTLAHPFNDSDNRYDGLKNGALQRRMMANELIEGSSYGCGIFLLLKDLEMLLRHEYGY